MLRFSRILLTGFFLVLLASPAGVLLASPAAAQEVDLDWVDAYVEEGMAEWDIPGLAVSVVAGDELVLARGYGVRELGRGDPVDEHTLFGVASTTKAMTVAALAMLVDEGRLDWDAPVVEYMPDFRLSDPWVTRRVTPRDLLTHRVGVGRMTGNRIRFLPDRDRREVLARMRHHEFEEPFRQGYVYSNVMYSAAGELIPSITGESWDDFLMGQLFAPLGMDRSNTSITMIGDGENYARPHQEIQGEVRPIPHRNFDNVGPSASVNTSVTEMARWMRMQLGEPGVFEGVRLVSEKQMREMHHPQNVLRVSDPYREMAAYGLGWRIGEYRGHRTLSHGGATDGMNTHLVLVPGLDLGVVVMTNTFNNFRNALANEILDAFLDRRGETDWHHLYRSGYEQAYDRAMERREAIEARRVEGTSPTLELDAYAGTYEDDLYLDAEVTLTPDGSLAVRFWDNEEMTLDLEHWHHDTFRASWRNPAMREKFVWFDLDDGGEVHALNVRWTLRPVLLQVGIYPTEYSRVVRFQRVDRLPEAR